ncbi:hypothetical protein BU24DRAFT_415699 [Aaosphaeria arxii CBS 175.79]|uniref:Uncharacterized protein n=1 Tax=Aaosphaeria arxii CBS 175.79 TaxID=1450172 RepID=A0A6A5X6L7_9PLEO|nr:uncharacterized protein BU24DRAFT_415699 [Aaosphaeria arxii CBS 175.79]KAF2008645.1 hypothetical protein BU24DRAFT_415699 [Aaosphaeria arxii CBS 175.79]
MSERANIADDRNDARPHRSLDSVRDSIHASPPSVQPPPNTPSQSDTSSLPFAHEASVRARVRSLLGTSETQFEARASAKSNSNNGIPMDTIRAIQTDLRAIATRLEASSTEPYKALSSDIEELSESVRRRDDTISQMQEEIADFESTVVELRGKRDRAEAMMLKAQEELGQW